MTKLKCVVYTLEKKVLDEEADFVALPLYDGEIGIAPGRRPVISRLGLGEMRLTADGKTQWYYINGGFVRVDKNKIWVLTDQALPAQQLDPFLEELALDSARRAPANTPELLAARDRAVTQARARLRVARRSRQDGL
jgi:F-type H+-transporting ATPase subunit epsilon